MRIRLPSAGQFLSAVLLCAAIGLTPAARAESLLNKVKDKGVIVIGTSNDPPLSHIDPATKQAAGVLPDVLREFLSRQGIKARIEVVAMPFASLIPAVQSNRIDLMGDAMYIRPERQKVMDFTDVIFFNPESLDVAKGNPLKLHALSDLCGHSGGSYQGTVYIDMLKKASAACPAGKPIDVKQYPTIQNVFADLSAGRLDAGVVDGTLSAYAVRQNPSLSFELVADYKPEDKLDTACAFAVNKEDTSFIAAFNKVYAQMRSDGTAAKLFEKWGLSPSAFFLNP
ncbi:substrate-binding periplasmic protein [Limobrevibacterium gyesilva]|uniref:ABC transporter substrate-binding protein n=1 Tax=Limobrevibacterium gyesilva TaxID=2991712 RepID=A0AA41YVN1_9PROT|nr:ABC transporter substrate-binding protein [Limobrevibacterium gyesilva]MCW3476232.1 ABC transporter substrate-binding protein [Limobrevibacterium gyesilva]